MWGLKNQFNMEAIAAATSSCFPRFIGWFICLYIIHRAFFNFMRHSGDRFSCDSKHSGCCREELRSGDRIHFFADPNTTRSRAAHDESPLLPAAVKLKWEEEVQKSTNDMLLSGFQQSNQCCLKGTIYVINSSFNTTHHTRQQLNLFRMLAINLSRCCTSAKSFNSAVILCNSWRWFIKPGNTI